jgi:hypothetical protein
MTEADTESIWDLGDFDTTRFGKIGVRMAAILNFYITGDATSQITNTAVTPILVQISEEAFRRLVQSSKGSKFNNPWDFIASNTTSVMSQVIEENKKILQMISDKLYGRMEIVTRELDFDKRTYNR